MQRPNTIQRDLTSQSQYGVQLPEPQYHQDTERNKPRQNKPIPPLLTSNPPHQHINPRNLTRRPYNPPINTSQRFPLRAKLIINSIRLRQYRIRHPMRPLYPLPFTQHILRLRLRRVRATVRLDIIVHIRQQIRLIPRRAYLRLQPQQLIAVL